MNNHNSVSSRTSNQAQNSRNWRSWITVGLWAVALGSHLILVPQLLRELIRGDKNGKRVFQ